MLDWTNVDRKLERISPEYFRDLLAWTVQAQDRDWQAAFDDLEMSIFDLEPEMSD